MQKALCESWHHWQRRQSKGPGPGTRMNYLSRKMHPDEEITRYAYTWLSKSLAAIGPSSDRCNKSPASRKQSHLSSTLKLTDCLWLRYYHQEAVIEEPFKKTSQTFLVHRNSTQKFFRNISQLSFYDGYQIHQEMTLLPIPNNNFALCINILSANHDSCKKDCPCFYLILLLYLKHHQIHKRQSNDTFPPACQ